jgi:predicted acyl esterase
MRARYRESLQREKLVVPGEINLFDFNKFSFFSRMIRKESLLRLVLNSPNSTDFQRNFNSGGIVNEETAKDARTAEIHVYHDRQHPSALEVPVAK